MVLVSYGTRCCPLIFFFFSSRRRHTRFDCDWSSDVCSSDLVCRYCQPAPTVIGAGVACRAPAWMARQWPGTSCVMPTFFVPATCFPTSAAHGTLHHLHRRRPGP